MKPENIVGKNKIACAKMIGITPEAFTFNGKKFECRPVFNVNKYTLDTQLFFDCFFAGGLSEILYFIYFEGDINKCDDDMDCGLPKMLVNNRDITTAKEVETKVQKIIIKCKKFLATNELDIIIDIISNLHSYNFSEIIKLDIIKQE